MPGGGIEPPCPHGRTILSRVRLPVPPSRHATPEDYSSESGCSQRKPCSTQTSSKEAECDWAHERRSSDRRRASSMSADSLARLVCRSRMQGEPKLEKVATQASSSSEAPSNTHAIWREPAGLPRVPPEQRSHPSPCHLRAREATLWASAGVAQPVERQLPKLHVASSNLVSRSKNAAAQHATGRRSFAVRCPIGHGR